MILKKRIYFIAFIINIFICNISFANDLNRANTTDSENSLKFFQEQDFNYFKLPELKLDPSILSFVPQSIKKDEEKKEEVFDNNFSMGVSMINETGYYEKGTNFKYTHKNDNIYEFISEGNYLDSSDVQIRTGALALDFFPDDEWSPFVFVRSNRNEGETYDYEYDRLGAGIAWVPKPLNNIKVFPFKHKFSLANVYESQRGNSGSFRYKFYADFTKEFSIRATYSLINYSENRTVTVKYKLTKYIALSYNTYFEEIETEGVLTKYHKNQLTIGFEHKWW